MIINKKRSIVPAVDVYTLNELETIVKETCNFSVIGAYKVGFTLVLKYGLFAVVDKIRKFTDKPIIYDHQKAGTDIPDIGPKFMSICKTSGVDAVIIFPQSGPKTQEHWIKAAQGNNLNIIVGGLMTHEAYVRSEGGYICDDAINDIYVKAIELGVRDFVVPGNKKDKLIKIKDIFNTILNEKEVNLYSPGFIKQGGKISETADIVSNSPWHTIIGRAICDSKDIGASVVEYSSNISD